MKISNTGDESVACVGFRHTCYILPTMTGKFPLLLPIIIYKLSK
jgi:hypothetical protein